MRARGGTRGAAAGCAIMPASKSQNRRRLNLRPTLKFVPHAALLAALVFGTTGCAAALIAGGVAGGYMVAKDMEDGHLIDPPAKKKSEGNKGWLEGFGKNED